MKSTLILIKKHFLALHFIGFLSKINMRGKKIKKSHHYDGKIWFETTLPILS